VKALAGGRGVMRLQIGIDCERPLVFGMVRKYILREMR